MRPVRTRLLPRTIATNGLGRRSTSEGGFSLVEALVASTLLATALAGLAHLFVVASRANIHARDTTYATVLAAQKLEELRAGVFPEHTAGESIERLDARGRVLADGADARHATYQRRWTIEPLPAYPLDAVVISVVVSRRSAPNDGAVHLTTIRARKGL